MRIAPLSLSFILAYAALRALDGASRPQRLGLWAGVLAVLVGLWGTEAGHRAAIVLDPTASPGPFHAAGRLWEWPFGAIIAGAIAGLLLADQQNARSS